MNAALLFTVSGVLTLATASMLIATWLNIIIEWGVR